MKKRNTLAILLAVLLACGSISVYAFGDRNREVTPDTARYKTNGIEMQKTHELTDEQKAEMLEKAKTALSEKLANSEITQEQYDEAVAKLEAGEMPFFGNGKGFGHINKGNKPERPEMPEFTEEQKAEMLEKVKTNLSEKLANGEITQEQYDDAVAKLEAGEMPLFGNGNGFGHINKGDKPDRPEMPELTEEQKAEILEKAKTDLSEKLASGEITQEQYDEALAKLEAGEIPHGIRGRGIGFGGMEKPEKPELTEEQKTEMLEKAKTDLSEKLANGEITEEQYNERLEKLEAGELPFGHTVGKGFSRGKTPVRDFGGFEGRGNGFGRRPSEIPYDGEVEADEAVVEVVEVRANARKTFGGRNFGGMRKDADVKL